MDAVTEWPTTAGLRAKLARDKQQNGRRFLGWLALLLAVSVVNPWIMQVTGLRWTITGVGFVVGALCGWRGASSFLMWRTASRLLKDLDRILEN